MAGGVGERVAERLREVLGEPDARAAVTFLGARRIEVLRVPDPRRGLVRYVTSGMSDEPMTDPAAALADPLRGPRAELLLTLRAGRAATDGVHRALAVFAASPQVEGLVVAAGGSLDLGQPLWPGAPFTSVLTGEPGAEVPDLTLPAPCDPVRFFPLLPMTPNEAAWKRVHGAAALEERWLHHGTDLCDPTRAAVPLGP
ncbi:suppressor of fused domain protein [Streptomyces marincola]|uniref:Suppressor of fused domain protein n=1 Tax=Streptomyces marincola TaxID=2878388 RepID=A0A1W7CVC5_9ACTN|nr:suppressor of fused domain protein [Streptomyces marincola]ARQ68738.1 Suppressor of fused domain protein [Streptomyces marincola]